MAILQGDEVVSAVAYQIRTLFSTLELKAVYKNLPQQGIQKPYAFIHQINAEHHNQMMGSATWDFLLDVRVHPQDNQTDLQSWARQIAFKLIDAINTITISDQIVKSRSLEYRVEDAVLHFIVSYSYRVRHVDASVPDMETLEYGTTIKQ